MSGPNRHHGVLYLWLTPMRAARGPMRETGVLPSFAIHIVGLGLLITGIGLFDDVFWDHDLILDLRQGLEGDTFSTLLFTGIWLIAFELCFVILAWMTTCWGAGVEPFKASFGRSLSRWYQLTPWLALLSLGLILAIQGFKELDNWYWDQYDDARWGDYYDHHTEPLQLLTYDRFELLLNIGRFGTLGIVNLIALWWTLGTVMVHRNKPTWFASCRWPATCEGCGYALAGLTEEQGCPECGKAVHESKHTDRGHREIKSLRLLWRGLFKPSAVGAAMATRQPTKMPLRVLLWGLLFAVLAGPVTMLMVDMGMRIPEGSTGKVDDFGDAIEYYIVIGLTVGIYAALIGSLLLLGAGTLVGTIVRVMGKRDIMPAACSAACYSAALLPVWVLLQGAQALILYPLASYIRESGRYDLLNFLAFIFFMLHAAILIYIPLHIARITKAARYANI